MLGGQLCRREVVKLVDSPGAVPTLNSLQAVCAKLSQQSIMCYYNTYDVWQLFSTRMQYAAPVYVTVFCVHYRNFYKCYNIPSQQAFVFANPSAYRLSVFVCVSLLPNILSGPHLGIVACRAITVGLTSLVMVQRKPLATQYHCSLNLNPDHTESVYGQH